MVYIQQIDTIWARLYFFPPVATRHPRPTRAHFDRICAAFLQAEDGPDFGFEIDFETRKKNGEEVRRNREEVRKYRADWNTWAYYCGFSLLLFTYFVLALKFWEENKLPCLALFDLVLGF